MSVVVRQEPGALVVVDTTSDHLERYVTADRELAEVFAEINARSALVVATEVEGKPVIAEKPPARRPRLGGFALAALALAGMAGPPGALVDVPGFSSWPFRGFGPVPEPKDPTQADRDALARAEAKRERRRARNRKLMPVTKVLFLDVDGVLNHLDSFKRNEGCGGGLHDSIDAACFVRLQRVIAATGAAIVLSSSWRFYIADIRLAPIFAWAGLGRWIDVTPRAANGHRGTEIARWLAAHPTVTRYAIVDDDADMLPEQQPVFVQTSVEHGGLTEEVADRLIEILGAVSWGGAPARPSCSPGDGTGTDVRAGERQ